MLPLLQEFKSLDSIASEDLTDHPGDKADKDHWNLPAGKIYSPEITTAHNETKYILILSCATV